MKTKQPRRSNRQYLKRAKMPLGLTFKFDEAHISRPLSPRPVYYLECTCDVKVRNTLEAKYPNQVCSPKFNFEKIAKKENASMRL